jgi:hypothetical protein
LGRLWALLDGTFLIGSFGRPLLLLYFWSNGNETNPKMPDLLPGLRLLIVPKAENAEGVE